MQDKISALLVDKNLLLKNFKTLDVSKYSKKRSYKIYYGVDLNSYFRLVYLRDASSRLVKKDAEFLVYLDDLVQKDMDKIVKKKLLFYNSAICSKTLKFLKESGWECYDFV